MGCSSFARHYSRNRWLLSLPRGTKMFQFPRLPLPHLCIQCGVIWHYPHRVSPFGYLRFKACLTAPRSFSQSTTSFIGILRLGIHCMRLSNFLRSRICAVLACFLTESETLPKLLANRQVSNALSIAHRTAVRIALSSLLPLRFIQAQIRVFLCN